MTNPDSENPTTPPEQTPPLVPPPRPPASATPPAPPPFPAPPPYPAPPQYPAAQPYPPVIPPPPPYASSPPVSGPTGTLPPVSGPTGSLPTPMPPTYDPALFTQGYPGYPPVMAPKRRRTGVIVLSITTALFVIAAGVLGALFALTAVDRNELSTKVDQLTADNTSRKSRIESLEKELSGTKRDLADADEQVEEMTTQKKALADCLNAFYVASEALAANNGQRTADVNAKIAEYDRLCSIADKYL